MKNEVMVGIVGTIFAVMIAFIVTGLCSYIVLQIGEEANITVLKTLSDSLSGWGKTWFPIILIAVSCGLIIGLLVRGFRES